MCDRVWKRDEFAIDAKPKRSYLDHASIALAEYLGTAILVFLSCMGACFGMQAREISSMHTSFTAGLAVMVVIQAFGHISGAHVNPAVTLNALILKQITWGHLATYVGAQVLGSLSGSALFNVVNNAQFVGIQENGKGTCVNGLSDDISPLQGFLIETVLSMAMNFAICAAWDARNTDKGDSTPIKIGLVVVVLNLAGGVYTGASMNPMRSFGPAVVSGDYHNHWVYWAGPIAGAIIAALIYRVAFSPRNK